GFRRASTQPTIFLNRAVLEPELFISGKGKRFMLLLSAQDDSVSLVEFDRERAIASLDEGKAVIPVWLDVIYQQLEEKLMLI
ncbi:MAG: hypothetical protein ACIWVG_16765, partial [Gloeotrichia echinulata HAB0833]